MGLIRLIIFITIIYFIYRLVKKALVAPTHSEPSDTPIAMVKCQQCKVLFPQQEAITKNQHHFCSAAHLNRWLESND